MKHGKEPRQARERPIQCPKTLGGHRKIFRDSEVRETAGR